MRLRFLFTTLAVVLTTAVFTQEASIRGFVYEKETGEPVMFTNVLLEGTTYGSATDDNGYYMITRIPAGDYTLLVTNLEYDTIRMQVSLNPGQILDQKIYLTRTTYMLDAVNITAERQERKTQTRTSVVKVTPQQIKQLPSVGGQPDIAQYLQVLPGVVFTGDQGGQLYIRGGSPIQNKVLLDGMVIYNPFHSIGLFSVFETDIIRNADIFTGGFGAEYGGRISSVMDISTRDGNKKRLAGKVGASTFGAKVLLEGPIAKQKENGSGSSSFILSYKNSYLEESSKIFYDYIDTLGLPFNYQDFYGKVSINANNGSKVNFFGFSFNDNVNNYKSLSDFSWKANGGGTNFLVIPGKSPVLIEGNFAYSSYKISMKEELSPPKESSINGFNLGLNFTYFIGGDELKYGLEMLGFKTDYYFINAVDAIIQQTQNTTELAGYFKYKMTKGKFLIEPSVRLMWYASLSEFSFEPRLAMKYNATDYLRFKFAGGMYSQNLISARSDRDVVNLFYGFLSGPENLPDKFDGKEVTHALQKAEHLILGVEYDLGKNLTTNIEGYYKNYPQLTNINRDKLFDENKSPDQPDLLKKDFILEKGHAWGIDLSLKYDYQNFYIWLAYSYAHVNLFYEQLDGSMAEYQPHYDRRHNLNFVASVYLDPARSWELSGRWNYGSGFPFTQTSGYYEKIIFENGINSNYINENGILGILYGDLNKGRLPDYHRLDISLKKVFELGDHTRLEIDAAVTNVYNQENVFYVDRVSNEVVNQLPIMPSFGMLFSF